MATYYGLDLVRQRNALRVAPGCLAMWGMGQMGVALKGDDSGVIYIDLCLTDVVAERAVDKLQRAFPPPIEPNQITNATYVLCSHEHLDHTDPLTLGPLASASPQAKFVISGWAQSVLDEVDIAPGRRIVPPEDGSIQLGNPRLTAIPAARYGLDHDERGYRSLRFLLQWNA